MGLWPTVLLGTIAGGTILLGLPVGRLRRPGVALGTLLNATAIGVLLFLLWDVLTHGWEPVDAALGAAHDQPAAWGAVAGYAALFVGGLVLSVGVLLAYERWMGRARGAAATGDPAVHVRRLALLIASGIGVHNLAEGLAIGHAAGRGEIALAAPLVIGFALHNATEGFGIVAPYNGPVGPDTTRPARPSWGFLLLLGLIGGGPTLLGTVAGYGFSNDLLSTLFLTLAAGSILYVIVQLVGVAARARRNDLVMIGVLVGLLAGFATDAIVTAAGA